MKKTEWYKLLQNLLNHSPHSMHMGEKITKITKGRAEVRMDVRPYHLQSRGQLHGGWYGFVADTAGFFAVMSECSPRDSATTLEYKINLVASATADTKRIWARGKVVSRTKFIAVARMEVEDDGGKLLATAMGTYRIFPGKFAHPKARVNRKL